MIIYFLENIYKLLLLLSGEVWGRLWTYIVKKAVIVRQMQVHMTVPAVPKTSQGILRMLLHSHDINLAYCYEQCSGQRKKNPVQIYEL